MSRGTRTVVLATAVVVILAAGGCIVSLWMRDDAITIDRAWKCTQCGHVFQKEFAPDPWAISSVGPDGKPQLETAPCPECGGPSHLLVTMVCGKCGKVFQHLEELDPKTRDVRRPACPTCGSAGARPRAPGEASTK